jgi:ABC-type branched-subunit amino acid transport system ATPase component
VVTHSISIVPPATDGAGTETIELSRVDSHPLRIPAESGRTWQVVAANAAVCGRLAHEAMRCLAVERVAGSGGLLSATSTLENILLPAVYYGRIAEDRLAASVYEVFQACGVDRREADALWARPVSDLDGHEKRLACLVRALLMRPKALLFERLFEGLPLDVMQRMVQFPAYYRRIVPRGTVIFLDVAGMAGPELAGDTRVEAA